MSSLTDVTPPIFIGTFAFAAHELIAAETRFRGNHSPTYQGALWELPCCIAAAQLSIYHYLTLGKAGRLQHAVTKAPGALKERALIANTATDPTGSTAAI